MDRACQATRTAAPLRASNDVLAETLHLLSPTPVSPFDVMTTEGGYHTSHVDPNGFGTMLHMVRGRKAALIAVPRHSGVQIPPHLDDHWELVKRPDMDVYFVVWHPNQTL